MPYSVNFKQSKIMASIFMKTRIGKFEFGNIGIIKLMTLGMSK